MWFHFANQTHCTSSVYTYTRTRIHELMNKALSDYIVIELLLQQSPCSREKLVLWYQCSLFIVITNVNTHPSLLTVCSTHTHNSCTVYYYVILSLWLLCSYYSLMILSLAKQCFLSSCQNAHKQAECYNPTIHNYKILFIVK